MSKYALATIATTEGERAAIVMNGAHYRIDRLAPDLPVGGLRLLLDDWPTALARLDTLAVEEPASWAAARVDEAVVLTPVRYPNKMLCAGAIYSDHLTQMNLPATRWKKMPIFLRPPTTCISGPGTMPIPPDTEQLDWEVEMAVFIGARLTDGDVAAAQAAIAGYAVGIDFSCRDLLDHGAPTGPDLIRAKGQDNMAPIGPVMVPASQIADPQALWLRLWVNDELHQNGNTASMMFSVYEQVATMSRFITLEPGDVIFTGSPAGSAHGVGDYLKPGDRVRAAIDQLGALDITIAPSRRAAISVKAAA